MATPKARKIPPKRERYRVFKVVVSYQDVYATGPEDAINTAERDENDDNWIDVTGVDDSDAIRIRDGEYAHVYWQPRLSK